MSLDPKNEIRQDEDAIHTGLWMRLWRHVGLAHRQPDKRRLMSDVQDLQAFVDTHRPVTVESRSDTLRGPKAWDVVCDELLDKAWKCAKQGDVSAGYEKLHTAERESVPGMNEEERRARAQSIRAEVKAKLARDWRGRAILDVLGEGTPTEQKPRSEIQGKDKPSEDKRTSVSVAELADAIRHRNTHDRNMHRKMDKVRWQLAWLGLFIGALVLIAIVAGILFRNAVLPTGGLGLLPYCIYLGLLGGLMSSAMSAKGTDRNARTPEIGVEFYALVARSLLGAAASIPVYLAGLEGIVTIGGTEHSKTWGLLLLCFIAGFSERWFRGTVAAVSGSNQEKPVEPIKASK